MSRNAEKIPLTGGQPLDNSLFGGLDLSVFPVVSSGGGAATVRPEPKTVPVSAATSKKCGVVHLRIEKSGRGGKTVTILSGPGLEVFSEAECAVLLRTLKQSLGVGGTAGAPGTLEVQGDERPRVAEWLRSAGFSCKG